MTIKFELSADFINAQRIALTPQDVRYGAEQGFLKQAEAARLVELAAAATSSDPACEPHDAAVPGDGSLETDAFDRGQGSMSDEDLGLTQRKWLYLQLKAAYLCREQLRDPLEVVEMIYADFDYPASKPSCAICPLPRVR